jgi:hypothetical protein
MYPETRSHCKVLQSSRSKSRIGDRTLDHRGDCCCRFLLEGMCLWFMMSEQRTHICWTFRVIIQGAAPANHPRRVHKACTWFGILRSSVLNYQAWPLSLCKKNGYFALNKSIENRILLIGLGLLPHEAWLAERALGNNTRVKDRSMTEIIIKSGPEVRHDTCLETANCTGSRRGKSPLLIQVVVIERSKALG